MAADLVIATDVTNQIPKLLGAVGLAQLISAASEKLQARRVFGFDPAIVETFDGGPRKISLWLSRRPVVSIASVVMDTQAIDNSLGNAWVFSPKTGRLLRGAGQGIDPRFSPMWSPGFQNIIVTYAGGFNPIPADVKQACITYVNHLFTLAKATGVYKSESFVDWSYVQSDTAVPAGVSAIIDRYSQDVIV